MKNEPEIGLFAQLESEFLLFFDDVCVSVRAELEFLEVRLPDVELDLVREALVLEDLLAFADLFEEGGDVDFFHGENIIRSHIFDLLEIMDELVRDLFP